MHYRRMPDSYALSYMHSKSVSTVQDSAVLNIRTLIHKNSPFISADYGIWENRDIFLKSYHVTDKSARRYIY